MSVFVCAGVGKGTDGAQKGSDGAQKGSDSAEKSTDGAQSARANPSTRALSHLEGCSV